MATKQQIPKIAATFVEFQGEFSVLSTEDGQWVIQNGKEAAALSAKAIANRKKITPKVAEGILRLISDQALNIKALDGNRFIYNSKQTFKSYIDPSFVNWNLNKAGIATDKTKVQVHEMIGNGTFIDIFSSMPGAWSQKWLSQDQIIEFCETLPYWLRQKGLATFFLTKKDENKPIDENKPEDNLVVILVSVRSGGLSVRVRRLEDGDVWDGEYRHRVVSPQLISSVS